MRRPLSASTTTNNSGVEPPTWNRRLPPFASSRICPWLGRLQLHVPLLMGGPPVVWFPRTVGPRCRSGRNPRSIRPRRDAQHRSRCQPSSSRCSLGVVIGALCHASVRSRPCGRTSPDLRAPRRVVVLGNCGGPVVQPRRLDLPLGIRNHIQTSGPRPVDDQVLSASSATGSTTRSPAGSRYVNPRPALHPVYTRSSEQVRARRSASPSPSFMPDAQRGRNQPDLLYFAASRSRVAARHVPTLILPRRSTLRLLPLPRPGSRYADLRLRPIRRIPCRAIVSVCPHVSLYGLLSHLVDSVRRPMTRVLWPAQHRPALEADRVFSSSGGRVRKGRRGPGHPPAGHGGPRRDRQVAAPGVRRLHRGHAGRGGRGFRHPGESGPVLGSGCFSGVELSGGIVPSG